MRRPSGLSTVRDYTFTNQNGTFSPRSALVAQWTQGAKMAFTLKGVPFAVVSVIKYGRKKVEEVPAPYAF